MTLRVLLFAAARDRAGDDALTVVLSAGARVAELRCELIRLCPALIELLPRCAVACNADFVGDTHLLAATDEVAILPPVSGD